MPIETEQFNTGIRYYWRCPICSEMSLPFRAPEAAAAEQAKHLDCRLRMR
jgi:hypothetical protein